MTEHRRFETDVRRHFVGEVVATGMGAVRLRGVLFVYDAGSGEFVKKAELRERIFAIDNTVSITVLPSKCDFEALTYVREDGNLLLSDGRDIRLDIAAFGAHG